MNTVRRYLHITPNYGGPTDGLRWAPAGDAIEHADGSTFALLPEILRFLEGFAAERAVVHFNHVLHLLHILKTGEPASKPFFHPRRLHQAFRETRSNYRNAGALCAWLTQDVPSERASPTAKDLWEESVLQSLSVQDAGLEVAGSTLTPPLSAGEFEDRFFFRLARCDNLELRDWLRFGSAGAERAAAELTRRVPLDPPATRRETLLKLAERERLAGALPYVEQLESALSLPPRRLGRERLPLGGYADVATMGTPETLLPSQFAYDSLEFARRFAERELLYFRREAPPERTREELLVVLDQGVRTWGVPRLVLSAAAIALAGLADRRDLPFCLISTGGRRTTADLRDMAAGDLAALLEASDLSLNPGLALEQALENPTPAVRDVVLLSHPRSLRDPDVAAAARRLTPETRLFSLAVDDAGRVEYQELRRGGAIPLSRFRIDPARSIPRPSPTLGECKVCGWQGDLDPAPFPFFIGIDSRHGPFHLALDVEGDWLLTASRHGLLHATCVADGETHLLPRGLYGGAVLNNPLGVLGVVAGFVVFGQFDGQLIGFHYDFASHRCVAHVLHPNTNKRRVAEFEWWYLRRLDTVVVAGGGEQHAIRLSTGARELGPATQVHPPLRASLDDGVKPLASSASSPADKPCDARWTIHALPPQHDGAPERFEEAWHWPTLCFDAKSGKIDLRNAVPPWSPFIPMADGKPALQGCQLRDANCQSSTLAVVVTDSVGKTNVRLFRGPEGIPIGEYPLHDVECLTALSADGKILARSSNRNEVVLERIGSRTRSIWGAPVGRFPQRVIVNLGAYWLTITVASADYHFQWLGGRLTMNRGPAGSQKPCACELARPITSPESLPAWLRHDPDRYTHVARMLLTAVVDRFGQVLLYEDDGALAAMFFGFRDQQAVWLPDGTSWGSSILLGHVPTPGGDERIGAALQAACARFREAQG